MQSARMGIWAAMVAGAGCATAVCGQSAIPFTEEAVDRGLIYQMQSYPQSSGYVGFGAAFADLDADGDPDVVLLGAPGGTVGVFENNGDGTFIDRTVGSGIPSLLQPSAVSAADFDSDGDLDLYITQLGQVNLLLRNEKSAGQPFTFVDIGHAARVDDVGAGRASNWGDYDGDGRVDLYLCNYNGAAPGTGEIDNKLYRNVGNGVFDDVSIAQGVNDYGYGFQAVWFDYDRDGDVDLYLSNDRAVQPPLYRENQLWRNDDGVLTNVSAESGAGLALFSMGVACGDFDGNRWPDLYCTNIQNYPDGFNPLILNEGDGTFTEQSALWAVDQYVTSWGSIFFDYDNDGWLDLYVNNMFQPNMLHHNAGSPPCSEAAGALGVQGTPSTSYMSAIADVDGDGDLDLLVDNLGGNVSLFINNEGATRNWLRYRVVGDGLNTHAIGANVDTRMGTTWRFAEVLAGGNGYMTQNELTLHVGIDDAICADEVVVQWPGGEPTRTLTNLPANFEWKLYPPARLGDADGDGFVTESDFDVFQACFNQPFAPGCEMMDFDGDSDVDTDDAFEFASLYTDVAVDCDVNGTEDFFDLLDSKSDANDDGVLDVCQQRGDLNGDGAVDTFDLLDLLAAWGACAQPCPPTCTADISGADESPDCTVDTFDLLLLLSNWSDDRASAIHGF